MSALGSPDSLLLSSSGGYEIERSLRFNRSDTTELNFTPSSAGNQKTWTWSAWIKRSLLNTSGNFQHLFNPLRGGDGSNEAIMRLRDDNTLEILDSGGTRGRLITNQVFRDVSAWYHIVFVLDTTQATAANRAKLYVNGEQVTSFSTETYPSQNTTWGWNGAQEHGLGVYNLYNAQYFDGYMAEVNFVDGTALAPTDFGETDTETGAWVPKKYDGSYGTNGFYLNFSDNSSVSALGTDSSVNGNNWTPNNFSVTAGAGNDSLEDTPTNNWCTLNALAKGTDATLSNGNLDIAYGSASTRTATIATMGMSSGKWYWEHKVTSSSTSQIFGITNVSDDSQVSNYPGFSSNGWGISGSSGVTYHSATSTSYGSSFGLNDVIGCAFDADNGKIWWSKNGTFFASGDPAAGTNAAYSSLPSATYYPAVGDGGSTGTYTASLNFGQRAFDYTPPTGFKALNTANLPVPTIKDGTNHFDTLIYTGNATARSITGLNFAPDFVWHKARSAADDHRLMDSVRAGGTDLSSAISFSNLTDAEASLTGQLTQTSNGFDLVATTNFNNSGRTFVAWNWLAGGSSSSNTDGTITSTVSANVDAGFSIVSYTGDGTQFATIGHGLGVAPKVVIVKNRDSAYGWATLHTEVGTTGTTLDGAAEYYMLLLDSSAARANFSDDVIWDPTSTTFKVAANTNSVYVNANGSDYIAYCFAEVEGYSKFGSYTGNGSTDGPFVSCGFRPAWVMIKRTDSTQNWPIVDTKRDPHNIANKRVFANLSSGDDTGIPNYLDILSNGFKCRDGNVSYNASGGTYIFMAFAETPFKYSTAR